MKDGEDLFADVAPPRRSVAAKTGKYQQDYHQYLQSDAWKQKRQAILIRDSYLCQGCLHRRAVDVHHTTYSHIFRELMFQLISLCRQCHDAVHDKLPPPIDDSEDLFQ